MNKKESAKEHDSCVLAIAEELKKDKWEVDANIEGWSKPKPVGPYTPDLVAKKKGCLSRICEVATPEMFNGDMKRYAELKNYCAEYDYHFYILDKDGTRRQVDPTELAKK